MLGQIFDRHVRFGIDAVLRQKIIQNIFRRRALPRGIDGLSSQILNAADGIAVFHNGKHAERVDGGKADILALIEKRRRKVDRKCRDIHICNRALYLFRRGSEREFIIVCRCAGLVICHQLYHSHAGRTFQCNHADGDVLVLRLAAGEKRRRKAYDEQESDDFFHCLYLFSKLFLFKMRISFPSQAISPSRTSASAAR